MKHKISREYFIDLLIQDSWKTCDELVTSGVHALSIVAKTPEQWEKMSNNDIDPSPKCRGGFGK